MAQEKNFETKVKKYLNEMGAYTVKNFGNAVSGAGHPDLYVCLRGKFIGIELKAEPGSIAKLQLEKLHSIGKSGGVAVVLYPSGFKLFQKLITDIYCYQGVTNNFFVFKEVNKKNGFNDDSL